jgi:hypothetical protein
MKFKNIIFLDVDGVLNCELFYHSPQAEAYRKDAVNHTDCRADWLKYYAGNICRERIGWFNELCKETKSAVVLSSSWRSGQTIEELREMFKYCGGNFHLIDVTGYCESRVRGVEIDAWIEKNVEKHFPKIRYFDFYRYAIIDDDSDMLLNQGPHFFQTDNWSGLTPNTCYKIKRFLLHKTS